MDRSTAGIRRRAAARALAALALFAGLAAAGLPPLHESVTARPLAARDEAAVTGRVGGGVAALDLQFPRGEPAGPLRRILDVPDGRMLLDLTATGRVRQVTLGRERAINDTWEPDPGDWSLAQARALARPWLPRDARPERSETFLFRDRPGGTRDIFRSDALARLIPLEVYAQHGAVGPAGICAVTYYQNTAGGVAFLLVGLV